MATYIVGDVQGCYDALRRLLEHASFDEQHDTLCFCGDLVSRGEDSLSVLRFAKSLPQGKLVLGNHDITLLAIDAGVVDPLKNKSLQPIFQAPDCGELINWLRRQPLVYLDKKLRWAMVHAGIPPQWTLTDAVQYASEVSDLLQQSDQALYKAYLESAFSLQTRSWHESISAQARFCYITNALTRMRFVQADGTLDLISKQRVSSDDRVYAPWFEYPQLDLQGYRLAFGHWAALEGHCSRPDIYALDTGCVWGRSLTMLRLEDRKLFSVPAAI